MHSYHNVANMRQQCDTGYLADISYNFWLIPAAMISLESAVVLAGQQLGSPRTAFAW
jgi:hypothetical protein